MASVTGMTAEKIEEITGTAIVAIALDSNTGALSVTTRSGQVVNVGSTANAAINRAYPVGAIFMSISPTNPASVLGVGSWTAWGTGRFPVGVDATQTAFDTVQETGGSSTHALTAAELPSHTHANDHDHASFSTADGGAHIHSQNMKENLGGGGGGPARGGSANDGTFDTTSTTHTHNIDVPAYTGATGATGSGASHNNLPPYITCYMWRRTA